MSSDELSVGESEKDEEEGGSEEEEPVKEGEPANDDEMSEDEDEEQAGSDEVASFPCRVPACATHPRWRCPRGEGRARSAPGAAGTRRAQRALPVAAICARDLTASTRQQGSDDDDDSAFGGAKKPKPAAKKEVMPETISTETTCRGPDNTLFVFKRSTKKRIKPVPRAIDVEYRLVQPSGA